MDDMNQAVTATKPRRRMFSTAASQGALFGALSGLAFGLQLSIALPTKRSGAFILLLEAYYPILALIAVVLILKMLFWNVQYEESNISDIRESQRSNAKLIKFMILAPLAFPSIFVLFIIAFTSDAKLPFVEAISILMIVLLLPFTLGFPMFISGMPGILRGPRNHSLLWIVASLGGGVALMIMLSQMWGSHGFGYGVYARVLLLILIVQYLLAAIFSGRFACPLWGRLLSVSVAVAVISLAYAAVTVHLPRVRQEDFGYPEMAVIVIGYPLMGFVTWGLMDWFAKRAAGEKRQISDS